MSRYRLELIDEEGTLIDEVNISLMQRNTKPCLTDMLDSRDFTECDYCMTWFDGEIYEHDAHIYCTESCREESIQKRGRE